MDTSSNQQAPPSYADRAAQLAYWVGWFSATLRTVLSDDNPGGLGWASDGLAAYDAWRAEDDHKWLDGAA